MDKIAIFGAGGFGLEVAMLIEQIDPTTEIVGFFDDGVPPGTQVYDRPVLGGIDALNAWEGPLNLALALGAPAIKQKVLSKITHPQLHFPTLIHPSVIMGNPKYLKIGQGVLLCAGTILTTHITLGDHVLVNLACTIGHETTIGAYSAFMPTCNISGEVTIGEATYWGTGAKIINRKTVGDHTTIGAGAVVVTDIPAHSTAVGVPAKVLTK